MISKNNPLFYPCNIVGYIRLVMLVIAVGVVSFYAIQDRTLDDVLHWGLAYWLAFSLLLLDVLDGYLARKLDHVTKFGSLFDLMLDLLTHTFVWTLSGWDIAPFLIALEWSAGLFMAAFTMHPNDHWKKILFEKGPGLVRLYFRPMAANPLNVYSNIAHFVVPMSFFVIGFPDFLRVLLLPGLIIFELVTLYMIYTFMRILLDEA